MLVRFEPQAASNGRAWREHAQIAAEIPCIPVLNSVLQTITPPTSTLRSLIASHPPSGVISPTFVRLMERARARYAIEAPRLDPEEMPEPKPRIRVKAISERVAA